MCIQRNVGKKSNHMDRKLRDKRANEKEDERGRLKEIELKMCLKEHFIWTNHAAYQPKKEIIIINETLVQDNRQYDTNIVHSNTKTRMKVNVFVYELQSNELNDASFVWIKICSYMSRSVCWFVDYTATLELQKCR